MKTKPWVKNAPCAASRERACTDSARSEVPVVLRMVRIVACPARPPRRQGEDELMASHPTDDRSDDEVWLVRHGETEWSRDGRHTSATDLPLTEEGREVAEGLRDRLHDETFSLVLTSPRRRARDTARLTGHGGAEVDDDLAEWDYG